MAPRAAPLAPESGPPARAARPMPRLVGWLLILSVAVLFTVSGSMLWLIGYNYEA